MQVWLLWFLPPHAAVEETGGMCHNWGVARVLDYVRKQVTPALADEAYGRESCLRALISVMVFLAYLCFVRWLLAEYAVTPTDLFFRRLDFFLKRIIPMPLVALAGWGIYYGIMGVAKDRIRVLSIMGLAMNLVCLYFHGMVAYSVACEVYSAYRYYGGVIQVMTR